MSNFFSNLPADEQAEIPAAPRGPVAELTSAVLGLSGVVGCALEGDQLVVYVESSEAARQLPSKIEGYEVVPRITGVIEAQALG